MQIAPHIVFLFFFFWYFLYTSLACRFSIAGFDFMATSNVQLILLDQRKPLAQSMTQISRSRAMKRGGLAYHALTHKHSPPSRSPSAYLPSSLVVGKQQKLHKQKHTSDQCWNLVPGSRRQPSTLQVEGCPTKLLGHSWLDRAAWCTMISRQTWTYIRQEQNLQLDQRRSAWPAQRTACSEHNTLLFRI